MSDKYMLPFKQFPNRLGVYQWEFGQNQILRGPAIPDLQSGICIVGFTIRK